MMVQTGLRVDCDRGLWSKYLEIFSTLQLYPPNIQCILKLFRHESAHVVKNILRPLLSNIKN